MYASKYSASERIVIGKGGPSFNLGHPMMAQLEQVGCFPAGVIPLSNKRMVINEMSSISSGIARRRKWRESKISPFEDMVVDEYLNGGSLSQIRQMLESCGVSVARYSILRYINSLPRARISGSTNQS